MTTESDPAAIRDRGRRSHRRRIRRVPDHRKVFTERLIWG